MPAPAPPALPRRLLALAGKVFLRGWGLLGLTLGVFGGLFYPWAALALLAAVVALGRRAPPGRRLNRGLAMLGAVGVGLGASPYFLSRDVGCSGESAHLRWLSRGNATYDALLMPPNTLVMGRRAFYGQGGLLTLEGRRLHTLPQAQAVQSLLAVGRGRLLAADWGGGQLLALEKTHLWRTPLCRWPIELKPFGGGALALCEGDHKLAILTGWPPKVARYVGLSPRIKAPYSMAMNPRTGEVWVGNWNPGGGIEALNLQTGARRFAPTGAPVMGLAYLPERDELLAAMPLSQKILRLRASALAPVGALAADLGSRRLAVSPRAIAVVNYFAGTFQAWDRRTLRPLLRLKVGKLARGVQVHGTDAFVVSTGCGVALVRLGPTANKPRD